MALTFYLNFIVPTVINKMKLISDVEEIENNYFSVLENKQDINIFPVSLPCPSQCETLLVILFSLGKVSI